MNVTSLVANLMKVSREEIVRTYAQSIVTDSRIFSLHGQLQKQLKFVSKKPIM